MSAVLETLPARDAIDGAVHIPLAIVAASKTNPRKSFDAKKMAELAASIEKVGVLQPILVRPIAGAKAGQPIYEIVAGERRWRASTTVNLPSIPAIVKSLSDFEVLELQVIENLQRDDLHPLEEAEGYEALMRKPDGLQGFANVDDLAARIGKSRSYVFGRLKLCALIAPARKAFLADEINASTALLIARMPPSVQVEATKEIVRGWCGEPMPYRQARDYLERTFMLKLGSAPFKIADATLLEKAGSCTDCGKRTGANPGLFDDVHADVCTDSACFAEKKEAHQARLIAVAKEEGREVITGAAAKKVKPQRYGSELNGYMTVDEVHYSIDSSKPLAKLLGKDSPPIALLEDPHTRELVKVVRTEDAMKVLKDKGVVKTSRVPTTSDSHRKAEAKLKAETAWRTAVAERAIAATVDSKFDDVDLHAWLMPEVAIAMWDRLDHDTEQRAVKLLGWDDLGESRYSDSRDKKLTDRVHKLTAAELDQMLVAMTIAGQTRGSTYAPGKPERLLRIAKNLGVDIDAVKLELAAAAKTKAKPAPKKAIALKAAPTARAVRYRNAATGESWSGRGLQPAWLKAALKKGRTLADFDTEAQPATPPAKAKSDAIVSISFAGATLRVGDELRVKKTATGRKTAKDGRVGKVAEILEGGDRIVLSWGARPHERGVYDNHELERVAREDAAPITLTNGAQITPAAAWPFPKGDRR